MSMSGEAELTTTMTINEAIRRVPGALEVFGRYGIDACCGGGLPLEEAARRHGLDPESLLRHLLSAASGPRV